MGISLPAGLFSTVAAEQGATVAPAYAAIDPVPASFHAVAGSLPLVLAGAVLLSFGFYGVLAWRAATVREAPLTLDAVRRAVARSTRSRGLRPPEPDARQPQEPPRPLP